MKYWINVVSLDHVQRGMEGGFTQANHGKPWALRKMARGDYLVFYSPKTAFGSGEPLQAFTAIAQIDDDEAYQVTVNETFSPWRRDITVVSTTHAPIRPLIEQLDFIENKAQWGYKFRFGVIEISEHDFGIIKDAMNAELKDAA